MKFLVITHVEHYEDNQKWYAYAPYVREMNIWFKHVDQVEIVAPRIFTNQSKIDLNYNHSKLVFNEIPSINFTSFLNTISSIIKIPLIISKIFMACIRADHVHLRCPGNIGLLGCLVQICFPYKIKSAKYAGNWDPNSQQPLSYKFQKWLLRNTFLTRNIKTLVYGKWSNQSRNIIPFFTASYSNTEIERYIKKNFAQPYKFLFVGALAEGKRPILGLKLIEELNKKGVNSTLDLYGDGILKKDLEIYINKNKLEDKVSLKGNVDKNTLKEAYKKAHFVILPSKSEGWPKALAEGMFFGTIPIATKVSCIPWMLDEGRRGVLINSNLEDIVKKMIYSIVNGNLEAMSIASQKWSHQYTLERFDKEIIKLLRTR